MPTYRTPDVYVEEISVFPPSVAEVETAIPAFIGYTETASKGADDLKSKPTKVYSFKEFQQYFGQPKDDDITMTVTEGADGSFETTQISPPTVKYLLHYSVKMYFDNGGGQCYIVSVGGYSSDPIKLSELEGGLGKIELEDEPTLIVIPEAKQLSSAEYTMLAGKVLGQCDKLRDRFAIFDIREGGKDLDDSELTAEREQYGNKYLKYAAAYYPFLTTTLNHYVPSHPDDPKREKNVKVTYKKTSALAEDIDDSVTTLDVVDDKALSGGIATGFTIEVDGEKMSVTSISANTLTVTRAQDSTTAAEHKQGAIALHEIDTNKDLVEFESSNTAVYNYAKAELKKHFVTLPPSGAVAGIYAATDSNRGVWKAPANVSLANVLEPTVKLDNVKQAAYNVDATSGKSITAIRAFAGKGTLVWGARTLAGNDNEWRYVSVRRFFNMVEESVKKSTYWAVFEPNDANTWVKVRGMIENYLVQKWRDGALAGATPAEAFFVRCGLGITMDSQDILEGRMNVEIGMAVVRPAEFIILKFSHKLQTS